MIPVFITMMGLGDVHSWALLTVMATANNICLGMLFGLLPSYVNEMFATAVRSSGWGVAYGTAVIIPAFFSYYMVWLGHVMPFAWTAALLAVVGGVIMLTAAALGPETRGVDLHTVETGAELDTAAA